MAVTHAILPKKYANAISLHEQKKNIFSHATSVGNKQKQTEDRMFLVLTNIVSILSYPSKKSDENEVHAIKDLLQCSISSAYRWAQDHSLTFRSE